MFGFAELASLEYFVHLKRALLQGFEDHGREAIVHVCEVHPTASIRRRATKLASLIRASCTTDDGPIHIVGHSTGGLDARFVASSSPHLGLRSPGAPPPHTPSAHLSEDPDLVRWLPRLRSITTLNCPHHGTPLAAFFATVSGQRVLYALSALTVMLLKVGALPMATASALIAAFGRVSFGDIELRLLESTVDKVIRVLDEAASRELRGWLRQLRDDQGAIVQLMPEAMDLFQAGASDLSHIACHSIASFAPEPTTRSFLSSIRTPWSAASAAIFAALYKLTARVETLYPCQLPDGSAERQLKAFLGRLPPPGASDGVVPVVSQVWGKLLWAGMGDHLDVVGHFRSADGTHNDWLASGAGFTAARFAEMTNAIVGALIAAEQAQAC